jgi:hypothetical protein
MVMKKSSGDDSPLQQGVGKSFWTPSQSRVDDGDGLQYVLWKSVLALRVFTTKGIYRRKGDVRGGRGAHTTWWCGQGVAHATLWCGRLQVLLHLSFGLCLHVR